MCVVVRAWVVACGATGDVVIDCSGCLEQGQGFLRVHVQVQMWVVVRGRTVHLGSLLLSVLNVATLRAAGKGKGGHPGRPDHPPAQRLAACQPLATGGKEGRAGAAHHDQAGGVSLEWSGTRRAVWRRSDGCVHLASQLVNVFIVFLPSVYVYGSHVI